MLDGKQGNGFEGAGVLFQNGRIAWPDGVLRGDLLTFIGVKEVQVGPGCFGRTLFGDRSFDHCDRVFRDDGAAGVNRINFARAEFFVYRYHF